MLPVASQAQPLRVATYNTELSRKGPGLLLRDIVRGGDAQIDAVIRVIAETSPDILALQGIDYDMTGAAVTALIDKLAQAGQSYPHFFAGQPNTGLRTNIDMDGNGRRAEPRDTQGYGLFSGQGGMVVLSKYKIIHEDIQDFSSLLWKDLPSPLLPMTEDGPFPSPEAQAIQRLSTTAHWVIPIKVPQIGRVHVLTFHASPPVFDGPEDRNGKRNHDEIIFWQHYLNGHFGNAPADRFVMLADTNQDPDEGEGIKAAIERLLADPRLQDPQPQSAGSIEITGDPYDTADWDDPVPGNMRVDYVLPSSDWQVLTSEVHWPAGEAANTVMTASRHRLVWADLLP